MTRPTHPPNDRFFLDQMPAFEGDAHVEWFEGED
jgi:hypothetical protein